MGLQMFWQIPTNSGPKHQQENMYLSLDHWDVHQNTITWLQGFYTHRFRHKDKTVADVFISVNQMYPWLHCVTSSDFHPKNPGVSNHGHRWFSILVTWILMASCQVEVCSWTKIRLESPFNMVNVSLVAVFHTCQVVNQFSPDFNKSTVVNSGTDLGGWSIAIVDIQFDTWRTEKAKIATYMLFLFQVFG